MRILLLALIAISASFGVTAQKKTKQPTAKQQDAKQPAAKEPTADGKIGYIDVDNVIVQLAEYKQMEVKLEESRKKFSDELQVKRQSFESLYVEYMQTGKTMPDSARAKTEAQLQQMDAEIQQFQKNAENTFVNTRKLFLGPVYLKLGGVIRDVAIENGFSMILPYRIGNNGFLLQSDTTLDVSDLVVKKFGATK